MLRYRLGRVRESLVLPYHHIAYHQQKNHRIIKECIENGINSTPSTGYQPLILQSIKTKLLSSRLNKFNDFEDSFNGLGISVHDISAQKISLLSFQKYAIGWSATIHFVAQDHFGLDVTDIKNKTYSKYRFFRIWFFLQRHKDFAFKPFFTNFNTIERIENYLWKANSRKLYYVYFFYAASIIYGHCVLYRFCIHTLMLAIQSFWSLIICHGLTAIK